MTALLSAKIESLVYPEQDKPSLKDILLDFKPSEFVFLIGTPGSGKSSLCQALAGVIPSFKKAVVRGEVLFSGASILNKPLPMLAEKIGLVRDEPQDQLFCTTVEEDLAFGPCNLLVDADEVRTRIRKALQFVGLPGFERRKPETLSGGEAQRIALASVLTLNSEVIILDKATNQLDPQGRKVIYESLRLLSRQEKKFVIVVEEKAIDYFQPGDRIVGLDKASISFDGYPTQESLKSLGRAMERPGFTFKVNPREIPGVIKANPTDIKTNLTDIKTNLTDIKTNLKDNKANKSNTETHIVAIKNLLFTYPDGDFAFTNLCLDIYPGEFVVLLGKNGAGKTTLVKHLNGLNRPSGGDVLIDGMDTKNYSTAQLAERVGYMFQNPQLQICTGSVAAEVGFALKAKKLSTEQIKSRINLMLERLGLTEVAEVHPYKLSKAELQRMSLASSLIHEPKVLVVDEPTSQMSAVRSWETLELITEYNRKGVTVIMITHDIKLALAFSTRMVLLKEGKVVLDIPTNRCHEQAIKFRELGVDPEELLAGGEVNREVTIGI